jgi:hypothetical protein
MLSEFPLLRNNGFQGSNNGTTGHIIAKIATDIQAGTDGLTLERAEHLIKQGRFSRNTVYLTPVCICVLVLVV